MSTRPTTTPTRSRTPREPDGLMHPQLALGSNAGWLLAGIVIGGAVGVGVMWWLTRRQGGGTGQTMLRESRFKRDEEGWVTGVQTLSVPVGVGSGTIHSGSEPELGSIPQHNGETPAQQPEE